MSHKNKLHEVAFKLWKEHRWSFPMIGELMGVTHTAALAWIMQHQKWMAEEKERRSKLFADNCRFE